MRHAVIMAGGSGTRLWPLSRNLRPKQMLRLFGGESLLQLTCRRLEPVVGWDSMYVVTLADHLDLIRRELPDLPESNLIGEPCGRNTANAIGLAAAILREKDPDAIMGVFTADHLLEPAEVFARRVQSAFSVAERHRDALLTLGVVPQSPQTGYGYLEKGERVEDGVFRVSKFAEKPDLATAERYLADGRHYWNSGMFVWHAVTVLNELREHLPDSARLLEQIGRTWGSAEGRALAEREYAGLENISIDFAVMEKTARQVYMLELECSWLDVGTWPALAEVLEADADGNVSATVNSLNVDSRGLIVAGEDPEHLVATIGVDDLVIVHSPDATLICSKERAQDVRRIVELLKAKSEKRYL